MALALKSGTSGSGVSFPRIYLDNRFVYVVLSAYAGGMTIGVDLNPDNESKFSCLHCEMQSEGRFIQAHLDIGRMAAELTRTLALVRSGRVRELPDYRFVPDQLLRLRHVELSGKCDPTLAAEFSEALGAVIHVRALSGLPFFKLVFVTAGIGLELPGVRQSLGHLTRADEVWVKLDGGTQAYLNKVNCTKVSLEKLLSNILLLGRERPVVIQSLFPGIHGFKRAFVRIASEAMEGSM